MLHLNHNLIALILFIYDSFYFLFTNLTCFVNDARLYTITSHTSSFLTNSPFILLLLLFFCILLTYSFNLLGPRLAFSCVVLVSAFLFHYSCLYTYCYFNTTTSTRQYKCIFPLSPLFPHSTAMYLLHFIIYTPHHMPL